jgi:lipopolysaccharide heptosyltransferase II
MPDVLSGARRILAVRLDNVGDVVLLSPALRALREAAPAAHITLLCTPAGAQVAPLLPWVDDVLVRSVMWQDASGAMPFDPEREQALVATLREGAYDAAFIFTSFSQSPHPPAYVCYLAGIPLRAGRSKEFGGGVLFPALPALPDDMHQAERNLRLIEDAGIAAGERHLELSVPEDARMRAGALLAGAGIAAGAPFVVIAPGASCAARRYPAERVAAVARELASASGLPVVVIGNEKERPIAGMIAAAAEHGIALAGETTIGELAAIIERAALLVANDSGPMHIADALVRPMVILFSGTELERQWAPRNAPATLLRRETECSPCYGFTCPFELACLDIAPQQVAAAALRMLREQAHAEPLAVAS